MIKWKFQYDNFAVDVCTDKEQEDQDIMNTLKSSNVEESCRFLATVLSNGHDCFFNLPHVKLAIREVVTVDVTPEAMPIEEDSLTPEQIEEVYAEMPAQGQ